MDSLAMMKTVAILLFSAFALTGCATDSPDDLNPIDKQSIDDRKDVDQLLEPAVAAWAKEFAKREVGPQGQLADWAEEIIIGEKLYTILHGRAGAALLDALGEQVLFVPCHVCGKDL